MLSMLLVRGIKPASTEHINIVILLDETPVDTQTLLRRKSINKSWAVPHPPPPGPVYVGQNVNAISTNPSLEAAGTGGAQNVLRMFLKLLTQAQLRQELPPQDPLPGCRWCHHGRRLQLHKWALGFPSFSSVWQKHQHDCSILLGLF